MCNLDPVEVLLDFLTLAVPARERCRRGKPGNPSPKRRQGESVKGVDFDENDTTGIISAFDSVGGPRRSAAAGARRSRRAYGNRKGRQRGG